MPRNVLDIAMAAIFLFLLAAVPAARAVEKPPAPSPDQVRFFESKIRPLLVDNCLKCHGPEKQKSGLRLDNRASALAGGDLGPAVVPGKPDESLLVTAVRHDDDALKMPPSKKLSADQVADLTRWVAQGAPWPATDAPVAASADPAAHSSPLRKGPQVTDKDRAHWAFQPVKRPPLPKTSRPEWSKNPVDAFILAGLDAKGLKPNPEASRVELIRRATYDLTGLPPTPEAVEAFLKDDALDAYDRLVDKLLDSPQYGEKWARHWLDLVRFAETNSFERDDPKPNAWRFRDYVIRSLNQDKPFDRFTREQLAGDEIAPADNDAIIATGYYRLGIWDDEPADRAQALYDGLDDVVATTSQVFLGLTVDCARCHDHKIDPIPQKDYYKLVSFFRNIQPFHNGGPTDQAPIFTATDTKEAFEERLRERKARQDGIQASLLAIEKDFLNGLRKDAAPTVAHRDLDGLRYRFYRDTFDGLPDFDVLKPEDVGELPDGRFDLAPKTRNEAIGFVFEGTLIVPEDGPYTFSLDSDDGARLSVDGKPVVTYDGVHTLGMPREATVPLKRGRLPIRLDYFQTTNALGLRVAWSGPGVPRRMLSATPNAKGADLERLVRNRGEKILGADRARKYQELRRDLNRLLAEKPPGETALCVTEAGPKAPETHVLLRGNPHVPGEVVEPGFLTVLGAKAAAVPTPAPGAKSTGRRTALADWITSPDNPLTSRVFANRVWQYHFGRGIVRSPSNFGTQGDRPTHPELLDWLASELVANGWRLKPLHKLLMTSNAYKMSSRPDPSSLAKDPMNNAFWRADMRRLTAEEIRDSVLAVSGNLNPAMYGPGVYPEIPAEVMSGQSQPGKGWGRSSPVEAARRSIYVHVKRSLLMPILESLDAAETDRSTPVRFSTTQPTQALAMLNGKFLNDQAALLAARLRSEAGADPAAQVRRAFLLAASRPPTDPERERALALMKTLRETDGASPDDALKDFCLVVLNLNEFVFLD